MLSAGASGSSDSELGILGSVVEVFLIDVLCRSVSFAVISLIYVEHEVNDTKMINNKSFISLKSSLSNYLRSEKVNTLPHTVGRHLELVFSSKMASKCERFDIIGKSALKTKYKSYVADPAIHAQYPQHRSDLRVGAVLENIVYNELVSRGYTVSVGKLRSSEVDFVVTEGRHIAFVQVTYMMGSEETERREFAPLMAIRDNHPKYVISMDPVRMDRDGIRHLHLVDDFLLGDGFVLR